MNAEQVNGTLSNPLSRLVQQLVANSMGWLRLVILDGIFEAMIMVCDHLRSSMIQYI